MERYGLGVTTNLGNSAMGQHNQNYRRSRLELIRIGDRLTSAAGSRRVLRLMEIDAADAGFLIRPLPGCSRSNAC
jgi:hypothetical protein